MKICIIGGGNIGTLMAAEFSHRGYDVSILTSRPMDWSRSVEVYNQNDELLFTSNIGLISNDMETAIKDRDIIFITLPPALFQEYAKKLVNVVKKRQIICAVPGTGGAEFAFNDLIEKGCCLIGLQRVHSIARLKQYGHSVYELGRKKEIFIGSIPKRFACDYANIFTNMFGIRCNSLPNYLNVTFTPSNPILHTSRLYGLFGNKSIETIYPRNIMFYEEWDDISAKYLLNNDAELANLCKTIPMDLSGIVPLSVYYESDTPAGLVNKFKHISAFKGITSPMVKVTNGWMIDKNSRYFTSDFPYGLKILIDFADVFEVPHKQMSDMWNWFATNFNASSVFKLTLSKEEILNIYKR